MPETQRLHLVRHGETVGADSAYVGDPPLTELGKMQSEITAQKLLAHGVSSVFVSPQLRARQTASPTESSLNTSARTVDDLREISLGDYPGDKEVGRSRPLIEFAEWGGESGTDFYSRVVSSFTDLLTEARNEGHEDIAVISHGGTINVILDHIRGHEFDGSMRTLLSNCSISTLSVGPDSVSVAAHNGISHLPSKLITPRM